MKKEFVNPTMRFSFFSRENIVTASGSNMGDAMAEFEGTESNTSVTKTTTSKIKEQGLQVSL